MWNSEEHNESFVKVENEILELRAEPETSKEGDEHVTTSTHPNKVSNANPITASKETDQAPKYYCHMPLCQRKSFNRYEPYQLHIKYHQLNSVYGCSICHNLNPKIKCIIGHLCHKHKIKKADCLNYVYIERTEWIEASEQDTNQEKPCSNSPEMPTIMNLFKTSDSGLITIKSKKIYTSIIDVANMKLPEEENEEKLIEEVNEFASGGLFDRIFGHKH